MLSAEGARFQLGTRHRRVPCPPERPNPALGSPKPPALPPGMERGARGQGDAALPPEECGAEAMEISRREFVRHEGKGERSGGSGGEFADGGRRAEQSRGAATFATQEQGVAADGAGAGGTPKTRMEGAEQDPLAPATCQPPRHHGGMSIKPMDPRVGAGRTNPSSQQAWAIVAWGHPSRSPWSHPAGC